MTDRDGAVPGGSPSFLDELKRRKVIRVVVVYAAVAWFALQVVATVGPLMELPQWVGRAVLLLLGIGFPVAVGLAWVFDVTPEGVRKAPPTASDGGGAVPASGGWFSMRSGVLTALLVGGGIGIGWLFGSVTNAPAVGGEPGLDLNEASAVGAADERPSIAVLPFENRSADESDRFFTDGIHDDLLTHLSRIRSLRVTSRTSVMEYRDAARNSREIGVELGVGQILEGGVQKVGDRVRINVQLIDTETDEHLWAEIYDRDLSVADLLDVQTDIAETIAAELRAQFSSAEREEFAERPTESWEAYECFVRGNALTKEAGFRHGGLARDGLQAFECAVELDTNFAEAWSALAQSRAHIVYRGWMTGVAQRWADEALARAEELDADAVHVRVAEAKLLYWKGAYAESAQQFEALNRERRGDSEILLDLSAAHRRAGDWDASTRYAEEADGVAPRDPEGLENLRIHYRWLGRWDDELEATHRLNALAGDRVLPLTFFWNAVDRGDTTAARQAAGEVSEPVARAHAEGALSLLAGDFAAADSIFTEVIVLAGGDSGRTLGRLYGHAATAAGMVGDEERRRSYWEDRLVEERNMVVETESSESPMRHGTALETLAKSLVSAGLFEEAVQVAEQAIEQLPLESDGFYGRGPLYALALAYANAGREDDAMAQLARLADGPWPVSEFMLRHDPNWSPLWDHPQFDVIASRFP